MIRARTVDRGGGEECTQDGTGGSLGSRAGPTVFAINGGHDPFQREVDSMQAIYADLLLILGAIMASGILVMSELAIDSASKARLRHWSSQGNRGAGGCSRSQRASPAAALDGASRDDAAGNPGRRVWRSDLGPAALPGDRADRPPGAVRPGHRSRHPHPGNHILVPGPEQSGAPTNRPLPSGTDRHGRIPADPGPGDCGHSVRRALERGHGSLFARPRRPPGSRATGHRGRDLGAAASRDQGRRLRSKASTR